MERSTRSPYVVSKERDAIVEDMAKSAALNAARTYQTRAKANEQVTVTIDREATFEGRVIHVIVSYHERDA